jgi:hypothetical protein
MTNRAKERGDKPEKDKNLKQIPFRIHLNDFRMMQRILADDELKYQTFVDACVQAYIRNDPFIRHVVDDYKEYNVIPRQMKDRYTLSDREKMDLIKEIEESSK